MTNQKIRSQAVSIQLLAISNKTLFLKLSIIKFDIKRNIYKYSIKDEIYI
ncbi:hypothetical protein [Okeania sp.]|nr:hypothetical protein [Okeania sp.]